MLSPRFLYVGKPLIIFYIHIHTYASMHVYTIILFKWMICLIHACISAQLYPTLFYSMDCSLPVSSVHGIFQARIMERVAISSSRGSSQPGDPTRISCTGRQILYHRPAGKARHVLMVRVLMTACEGLPSGRWP